MRLALVQVPTLYSQVGDSVTYNETRREDFLRDTLR